MLGPSPALLTQSPSGFTVSEDPMGHPGPSVQETDIQVRTQHVELGCGQIHGSGLSTWSWGVDRYMGQDSAHGLECKQIHGSGLSTWAGV